MSNEWKIVRFGDVCTIVRGASPRPIDTFITNCNDGINWIKIGDANERSKYITETKQKISVAGAEKSRYVRKGDFILSNSMSFGRPYIMAIDGCVHDGWLIISDYDNTFTKDYLYYLLNSTGVYNQFAKFASGGVVNNLNSNIVRNISVLTYSLEKQQDIAAVLDKASELAEKRKAQLAELDALAESIFYDMFGDPVTNEKGWEVCKVIDQTKCIVPGRDKPKSFTGDIPWITTNDLTHLGYTYKANLFLSSEEIAEVKAKTIPFGSVIMTCVGDLGVVSIVGNDMIINQQLHAFICGAKIVNTFLAYNLAQRKDYMYKMASTTTVPYMNKTVCNSIPIILPPLPLQQQFAERIEKIEQQKQKVKAALKGSEDLFQRLMQDMFNPKL